VVLRQREVVAHVVHPRLDDAVGKAEVVVQRERRRRRVDDQEDVVRLENGADKDRLAVAGRKTGAEAALLEEPVKAVEDGREEVATGDASFKDAAYEGDRVGKVATSPA